MFLNEYQDLAAGTAIYQKSGSLDPTKNPLGRLTYSCLALCGEAGELANKLKKHLRVGTEPDSFVLADELGDVLWYVSAVARDLGLTLETVAQMNLDKLKQRALEMKVSG